jgi:hypothetical protein
MAFEFFKVPVHAPGAFADELNAFITGHRVAPVRKNFVRKNFVRKKSAKSPQKEGLSLERLGYRRLSLCDRNRANSQPRTSVALKGQQSHSCLAPFPIHRPRGRAQKES